MLKIHHILLIIVTSTLLLPFAVYTLYENTAVAVLAAAVLGSLIALSSYIGASKPLMRFVELLEEYVENLPKNKKAEISFSPKFYHPKEIYKLNDAFKTLSKRISRYIDILSSIIDIDKQIISQLDIESIGKTVCKSIVDVLGFEFCWLGILDEKKRNIVPIAYYGKCKVENINILLEENDLCPTILSIKTKTTQKCSDFSKCVHERSICKDLYKLYRGNISVPIIYGNEILGVLVVYSKSCEDFTQEDIKYIEMFASQTAIAIKNTKLFNSYIEKIKELETLIREIPVGIGIFDKDGKPLACNNMFCSMLPEESKKSIIEIEHLKEPFKEIIEKKSQKVVVDLEKDDTNLRISIIPLFDENNRIKRIVVISQDVTPFVHALRVAEESYRELKKLDELKSNIISNVSHELKTPITIAKGAIDIALEEENPAKIKEHLIFVKRNLLRLLNIIDDLITIAKVEKKGLMLEYEKVNIRDLIWEAVEEKKEFAKKRGVDVFVNAESFDIYVDKFEFKHVLLNLIDNAIKFNKDGGKVFIEAYKKDNTAVIKVRDTGIGIPEDKLDKIFEPFFQADPSTTRKYGGTGLGLTIVKRVVELHKGKVFVSTKLNKGSEFTIEIPVIPID